MAWLIRDRAKIKGQLDALKAQQKAISKQIKEAEAELKAIDAVIPHHEVKVDAQEIRGISKRDAPIAPHGQLGRSVLRCLREAAGKPLYTSEIAWAFAADANLTVVDNVEDVSEDAVHQNVLMDRVKDKLGIFAKRGLVRRHHAPGSNTEGSWSLIDQD